MRPALLTPRARRDLAAATRWIARDNKAAARALNDAVRAAAIDIATYPHSGRSAPEVVQTPYRLRPLRGFPYILVYNPELQRPAIMRIVHGARDLPEVLSDL